MKCPPTNFPDRTACHLIISFHQPCLAVMMTMFSLIILQLFTGAACSQTGLRTSFSSSRVSALHPLRDFELGFIGDKGGHEQWDRRRLESARREEHQPHRVRGNVVQPFPDFLRLSFFASDEYFELGKLQVMKHLLDNDSKISSMEGNPLYLRSYSSSSEDGFATVTVRSDGLIHAVIMRGGVAYQVDAIDDHEEEMMPGHARALRAASPHGMVMFRLDDVNEEELRCGEPGHAHADVPPWQGLRETFGLGGVGVMQRRRRAAANDDGDPARWTDCFENDFLTRKLNIGIAVDHEFWLNNGASTTPVQEKVLEFIADSNTIYAFQLNIYLTLKDIVFKTSYGGEGWNNPSANNKCPLSPSGLLNEFDENSWSPPSDQGLWHLLTHCYQSGTVGIAYIGVICRGRGGRGLSGRGGGWTTVAHEIGHNFGAGHSFEDGQGNTGGIMDYGSGKYTYSDGRSIYQFNPSIREPTYRKKEICDHVARTINCEHFESYQTICGNGVVERGEECECPYGQSTCDCCSGCVWAKGAECSVGECCDLTTCTLKPTTASCGNGLGHCVNGGCSTGRCEQRDYQGFCGVLEDNDCRLMCVDSGDVCRETNLQVGDDAPCLTTSQRARGVCANGRCVTSTSYAWREGSFGECSPTCGTGVQRRSVQCVLLVDGAETQIVSDNEARCSTPKPATEQSCVNAVECATYAWMSESDIIYTECSKECDGGIQYRTTANACLQTQGTQTNAVADEMCAGLVEPPPPKTRSCNVEPCLAEYSAGPFSDCSRPCCCEGKRTRSVTCDLINGGVNPMPDEYCDKQGQTKPQESELCNNSPVENACSDFEYFATNFGSCKTSTVLSNGVYCGLGSQTRAVLCLEVSNATYIADDGLCSESGSRPQERRQCETGVECPTSGTFAWRPDEWGTCNDNRCGEGLRTRRVRCYLDNQRVVNDQNCVSLSKPPETQMCLGNPAVCPAYGWSVSAWSACDVECVLATDANNVAGWGNQQRTVTCVNENSAALDVVDDNFCSSTKPDTTQKCFPEVCDVTCIGDSCAGFWVTGSFGPCSKPCDYGIKSRAVFCRSRSTGVSIDEINCAGHRPASVVECGAFACPTWKAEDWGACSVSCGDGSKNRTVACRDHLGRLRNDGECGGQTKPATTSACNDRPCAHWHKGLWSNCDKSCGGGVRTRELTCRLPHDGTYLGVKVDPDDIEKFCPADVPPQNIPCNLEPCAKFYWSYGPWGACSVPCGSVDSGTKSRVVTCVEESTGATAADERLCGGDETKPESSRACNAPRCPDYAWVIVGKESDAEWQECSASCGGGDQERTVQCHDRSGGNLFGYDIPFEVMDAEFCSGDRPTSTRGCNGGDTCGTWGVCEGRTCNCKPGATGKQCEDAPSLLNVRFSGGEIPEAIPAGATFQVSWEYTGAIDKIDVYLEPPVGDNTMNGSALALAVTPTSRFPNTGTFMFTMPRRPSTVLEGYRVRANPCNYITCGDHGICKGGICLCDDGYMGERCTVTPCTAIGCLESAPGVNRCVEVNSTSSCECEEGWSGVGCQHKSECEGTCANAGVADWTLGADGTTVTCGVCSCPRGSAWMGAACDVCGANCGEFGTANAQCDGCDCPRGRFGDGCQCRYYEVEMRLSSVGAFLDAGSLSESDVSSLGALFAHDVLKAIIDESDGEASSSAGFNGDVSEVVITRSDAGLDVSFHLRQECYDIPLARRRRLALEGSLFDAYLALYAQSKDRFSVLRGQGIVLYNYDAAWGMRGYDPLGIDDLPSDPFPTEDGGLSGGAIFGIVLAVLLVLGLIGGGVYAYRNPDDAKEKLGKARKSIAVCARRTITQTLKCIDACWVRVREKWYKQAAGCSLGSASELSHSPYSVEAQPVAMTALASYQPKTPDPSPRRHDLTTHSPARTDPSIQTPALPPGWEAVVDPNSGDTYYCTYHDSFCLRSATRDRYEARSTVQMRQSP